MIIKNSQYLIKSLTLFSGNAAGADLTRYEDEFSSGRSNEFGIDIRGLFQEINIYDSVFFPCVSGTIVIQDGIGLNRKIRFDGNEYIYIHMAKYILENREPELEIKGTFLIHKVTDRTNIGMNSEVYTLHFISPEFLLSEQQKIRRSFSGTNSEIIGSILNGYLNVPVNQFGKSLLEQTNGVNKIVIPNLTPFKAIDFLTSRSFNSVGVPDFLFWQDHLFGYNLASLTTIFSRDPDFEVNFGIKNLTINQSSQDSTYYYSSLLGANEHKIMSNFDLIKNVKKGYYAAKVIGYDPYTRKYFFREYGHNEVWGKVNPGREPSPTPSTATGPTHANKYPFGTKLYNKKGISADQMFESKIIVYPVESPRATTTYVTEKDPEFAADIDKTEDYVFQRQSILYNLSQRIINITMPGNFRLLSGKVVYLNIPHYYNERRLSGEQGDKSLTGKYIITAVRHIIRQDKHETIIEVATDSSEINQLTGNP